MATKTEYLRDNGEVFFPHTASAVVHTADGTLDDTIDKLKNGGVNTINSISNIAIDKKLVVAVISASASFSLASTPPAGREIHTVVMNGGNSDITITLPNYGLYVNLGNDTITVGANSYGEINCISSGTRIYIRSIGK